MVSEADFKKLLKFLSEIHKNSDIPRKDCVTFGHHLTTCQFYSDDDKKRAEAKTNPKITNEFIAQFTHYILNDAPELLVTIQSILKPEIIYTARAS